MGSFRNGASVGLFRHEDESFSPYFNEFVAIYPGRYRLTTSLWSFQWDKGAVLPSRGTEAARLSIVQLVGDGTGSVIHLDNSATANPNRLASKGMSINGVELKLTGNAGSDVYEHIGGGTTSSPISIMRAIEVKIFTLRINMPHKDVISKP